MRSGLIAAAVLAVLYPSLAPAQPAPAPVAATQGTNGAMKVHIEEVGGIVRVRADEKSPWKKATVGMDVDEGAEFQTGPKSFVRCSIPPDQSFTLDRLGTVKVLQAIQNGNTVKTDMLMKYGRTKYTIEQAGLRHQATIATPSNTLAVSGTKVVTFDQPPFAYVVETDHQIQLRDARRTIALGSNKSSARVKVEQGKNSAADTALSGSITDPRYSGARTQAENVYIAQQISRGGVVSFDPLANILVVRNSNPIQTDLQFSRALPPGLDITVRWNTNSDVNLSVFTDFRDPTSVLFDAVKGFSPTELLYPGYGLNVGKSGGTIPFDDRGGPKGGTELAFFSNPPKTAVFGIAASLISGAPANLKFNAFLNGQPINLYGIDATGNFVKAHTFLDPLPNSSSLANVFLFFPDTPLLSDSTSDQGSTQVEPGAQVAKRTAAKPAASPVAAVRTRGIPTPSVPARAAAVPSIPARATTPPIPTHAPSVASHR